MSNASASKHAKPAFDLVLGSDLVFNSKAVAPVSRLVTYFAAQGAAVILGHKLRHDSVDEELFSSFRVRMRSRWESSNSPLLVLAHPHPNSRQEAGLRLHEVRSSALDPAFRTPRVVCVFIHSPTVEMRPRAARALSMLDPSFSIPTSEEPEPPTPPGAREVARSIRRLQDSIRRYSEPPDGVDHCKYVSKSGE